MTAPDISPLFVEPHDLIRTPASASGAAVKVVMYGDYLELRSALTAIEARALRAEDACEKDGKARAEAGGMRMEIDELRSAMTASEKRIADAEREAYESGYQDGYENGVESANENQ